MDLPQQPCRTWNVNGEFISMSLHKARGWTYQFDGHIFISIEVFSQPQLAKVPAADFFAHAKVWADHKNSRVGPRTPAPMSSPAACRLRHLFPFLGLSFAPSLVKIHKLVIPWPLHGYSPAMQTIETPVTPMEEALGWWWRWWWWRTGLAGQRRGVAVKNVRWFWRHYSISGLRVYRTAPLLSASLFFLCCVRQRGSSRFSCSSLREAYLCLRSRQIVLGCAHWHSYSELLVVVFFSFLLKSTLKPSYWIHKVTWEHVQDCLIPSGQPSVAQWTLAMLQGHSRQDNQQTDWYDVSCRSAKKMGEKKKHVLDISQMLQKTSVLTVNPMQRNVKGIRKSFLQEKDYNFQEIFKPGLKEQTTSTKRLTLNWRVNHSIYVQIFHCTQLSLFCKNSFTLRYKNQTKS